MKMKIMAQSPNDFQATRGADSPAPPHAAAALIPP
jgi:hypothetical protein